MKGLFVTLDGLDGVGKTTLARALAEDLGGIAMDTPGPELRILAEAVLAGIGGNQTARCLFYACSVLAQGERARKLAGGGALVIMDRYWASTVAYGRARGVEVDLSSIAAAIPRPDLSILLSLDEAERVRRLADRGRSTPADAETLASPFRGTVLEHLRAATDVEVDLTGADRCVAIERIAALIRQCR